MLKILETVWKNGRHFRRSRKIRDSIQLIMEDTCLKTEEMIKEAMFAVYVWALKHVSAT